MSETILICPVCGRIHAIPQTKCLILLCHYCGAGILICNDKEQLIQNPEEVLKNLQEKGIDPIIKSLSGIPVPMMDGSKANIFVDSRFFHLEETDIRFLYLSYLEKGLTVNSFTEFLSGICTNDAQTVDVDKLRNLLGTIRWEKLLEKYHFFDKI